MKGIPKKQGQSTNKLTTSNEIVALTIIRGEIKIEKAYTRSKSENKPSSLPLSYERVYMHNLSFA